MSTLVHHVTCPVCGSSSLQSVFLVRDHTVSQKEFEILACTQCQHRFTQDAPGPSEIGAYYKASSYISHTDSNKGLINRLYKLVRNRTLVGKRKEVEAVTGLQKGRLLDIGAGTGFFLSAMKKHQWEVVGLEPDADARQVALQLHGIQLEEMDALFSLPPASFDVITLWHVLEHVHDLEGYVKRFRELLSPNGKLLIAVPNYTSLDAGVYGSHWAAYDVPRHLHHFAPSSMKHLLENRGFHCIKTKPMWFDAFYVCLLSSQYKQGKTNWIEAVWTGFRSNLKAWRQPERCSSLIYLFSKK